MVDVDTEAQTRLKSEHDSRSRRDGAYSRWEHLLRALRPNCDRKNTVVVALTAYFDASGSPDADRILVVSGWLGFAHDWEEFDKQWTAVLKPSGIKKFHMKEFAHSTGEFAVGWRGKESKRARFLDKLTQITGAFATWSFACAINVADWKKQNQRYCLAEAQLMPYPICGLVCIEFVRAWCDEWGYDKDKVLFVFEHGDKHQGMLRDRAADDFGIEVHFESKDLQPLQAADFAAYELLKLFKQLDEDTFSRFRESFRHLFDKVRYEHRHISLTSRPTVFGQPRPPDRPASSLERYCRDMKVPERAPVTITGLSRTGHVDG